MMSSEKNWAGSIVTLAGLLAAGAVIVSGAITRQPETSPLEEARGESSQSICYDVELSDPIQPERSNRVQSVVLRLDENGFPEEYRLFLQTHVCLEQTCKRLDVTLFWDALGQYSRLEYPGQTPLTKSDHKEFRREDYDRLDAILKNKDSVLSAYPLSTFVPSPEPAAAEVDAITSATPQSVQDAVVPGAAYTSWVLWHWVNGGIADQLFARTLPYCSVDYLNHCLLSTDLRFVQFALQHLLDNELYDLSYREACFQTLEKSGRANGQLTLQYIERLPQDSEELNQRLMALIGVNDGSSRLIIDYFETLPNLTPAFWTQMAEHLEQVSSYQDVHAILKLLENRTDGSEAIRLAVAKLITSDNRFIARRAREFLEP